MDIEKYITEAQQDTPEIIFDPETGSMMIAGKSFAEDVVEFYAPTLKWIDRFFASKPQIPVTVDFKMIYFSTATSKVFLDLLIKLENYSKLGANIKVRWFYEETDEDILEAGEEYSDMIQLDFEFKIYNPRKQLSNSYENQKRSA